MTEIQQLNDEVSVSSPQGNKYTFEDMKAWFYLMNAKPDTSIQLLQGRKKVTLGDLRDLNDRIQRKLENHNLLGQIASVDIIFDEGKIQDYSTWGEFIRENWNTINHKTEALTLTWDISIKLPKYEMPQRHTLRVRIGQQFSPKDFMHLFFQSDSLTELKEKNADGVVKVDFIDQVIAGELIDKVVTWYDGLHKIQEDTGAQKYLEKHKSLIVSSIHNFTPVALVGLYHYYFSAFCKWADLNSNLSLSSIQLLIILFISVFIAGAMLGKILAKSIDKKISDYKSLSQFSISKGDENAALEAEVSNRSITKAIFKDSVKAIATAALTFAVKYALEQWTK